MKYELPLFFVCIRTNVGYSVVAQFIVQSESVDCISGALNVLKEWKPNWNPPFFHIFDIPQSVAVHPRHFPHHFFLVAVHVGSIIMSARSQRYAHV